MGWAKRSLLMNIPALLPSVAAGVSLLLSAWLFATSGMNQNLQAVLQQKQQELQSEQQEIQLHQQQFQAQQEQINQGIKLAQEVGPAVLKDLASLAVENNNETIKKLLTKYGVDLSKDAAPTPKPATP